MIQAPEAFKSYRQFILWKPVPGVNGKTDKIPVHHETLKAIDPQDNKFNPHDPANRIDYQTANDLAAASGYGIGFVFTEDDPFFYIDIDHALADGQWSQVATDLCQYFTGCAVEISYSNTGLHIFGSGDTPPHGCKNIPLDLEFYTEKRFVALTGTCLVGDAGFFPPATTLQWLVDSYFPLGTVATPSEWTDGPCDEWSGPVDDLQLIEKMLASRSVSAVFGGRATIHELWTADEDALARCYPSATGSHPYDQSSADAALCAHLAFWTGRDCERIDRIFRMSGLMRDKWDARGEYYSHITISKAVGRCREVLGSNRATQQAATQQPGPDTEDGFKTSLQFVTIYEQVELFKGCVYIRDNHRVLTPDGAMLKSEQFRAMYGGRIFTMDAMNNKTSKNAFEVFTESQAYNFPKVFSTCFRPECAPGAIITEEGGTMVNTYVPAVVESKPGDPSPFLNHLAKLLPNDRDRLILLSYMAACVQHIGVKFQWCPLIQGVEGNGKTLLATCLARAVGWKYTHTPNANDLANKFNAWILGKLIILVEEIYVNDRKEAVETLKPLITNPVIEIQGKGTNQATGDNRANFFMCTNHKDAIRKTKNDRRYCVFYTAQQTETDIRQMGMSGRYFPDLYDWLRDRKSVV